MLKGIKVICIGVFVLAILANRVTRILELGKWQTSVGLILLAGLFYVSNIFLIRYFINKKAHGLMEIDLILPPPPKGKECLWEKTAGTGIVPKWVSVIGLLSISALITAVVPWIIALFK